MFRKFLGKCFPHLVAIFVFLTVAVLYCRPVFQNKVLFQEDVLQWQGMAQSSFQYKATHGHFPLWTNSMFSGMPAYLIAMDARALGITGIFYDVLTLDLKKPVSFFFLACLCFYFLTRVLKTNPYIGIIGALAYSYATYNPVIIAAGHDTKMQCIALLPALIASLMLIYEKKYWQGTALTALFTAMLVSINHMQIVYYCLIVSVIMAFGYAIRWIRNKEFRRLVLAASISFGAAMIGVLSNAVTIFTTYDSSKETTRGGSELASPDTDAKTSSGAGNDYTDNGLGDNLAYAFSMYKFEPFVLWVPEMYGGSTTPDKPGKVSKATETLRKMPPELAGPLQADLSFYWGGIGNMVGGPPYAGAVICFLALLGFFVLDNKHKWWILASLLLTIAMSWGGYFKEFNGLLLRWLPMFNKFRAPSMIIIIPVFLACLLAVLTLQKILNETSNPTLWKKYKRAVLLTTGVFVILVLFFVNSDYAAASDDQLVQQAVVGGRKAIDYTREFIQALKEDRQGIFFDSLLRSFLFTAAAVILVGLRARGRIRSWLFLACIGALAFADVMGVDIKYLNSANYQEPATYTQNFTASPADRQIMKDTGYYRVFDLRDSALNTLSYGAMTAYFHRSIGGYHAAKLKIYEDLIDHQLYNFPECRPVIDMLNTKYIIWPTLSGNDSVEINHGALGPAWFVKSLRFEPSPRSAIDALTRFHPADTAILFDTDRQQIRVASGPHPGAWIRLAKNDNDEITYICETNSPAFAVFSEIFYKRGWRAWIDDRETPIFRTDYVLRGMSVPAGRHIIRFVFHPQAYYIGRQVQWMANMILLLLLLAAAIVTVQEWRASFISRTRTVV
jgi:Bacterial membrane protein YfhO